MKKTVVGIFVFDDVEVLDFAGPFEVFSRARTEPGVASRLTDETAPFEVYSIGRSREPIRAVGGLEVVPARGFESAPSLDVLVVPGGFGTRALLTDSVALEWIESVAATAAKLTSVCTGALLYAKLGLLRGRRATTHWGALDRLSELDPSIQVQREARVVDDTVATSAGVAAGIDLAFHIVETICGTAVADETAHYIEYPRSADCS